MIFCFTYLRKFRNGFIGNLLTKNIQDNVFDIILLLSMAECFKPHCSTVLMGTVTFLLFKFLLCSSYSKIDFLSWIYFDILWNVHPVVGMKLLMTLRTCIYHSGTNKTLPSRPPNHLMMTQFTWPTDVCAWFQIANFMGPIWGPPGSCRPQMGPMLAHEPCYKGYHAPPPRIVPSL